MTYRPPTRVVTTQVPWLALVTQADPDWARKKYREVEYAFDQRAFFANPNQRGAYNRLGNTYPVGTQYGTPDPLITANLAPTVGNVSPGLYEGIPDGKGWA